MTTIHPALSLGLALPRYGSAIVGAAVWAAALLVVRPLPGDTAWGMALLVLAPLVMVPLALRLNALQFGTNGLGRLVDLLQLPAALAFGAAFLLPRGLLAAALALPWLATTGLLALLGLSRLWQHRRGPLSDVCLDASLVYVSIGGFWAVLDRWGARPLDFEAVIVLLTAIHFHYAGFALPLLTGLALRQTRGALSCLAGVGVVTAVPLVAVGITVTQLNGGPLLECVAAGLMAGAGLLTGWLYFRLARQTTWPPLVRALWAIAAMSLTGSMGLAVLYGMRWLVPLAWLEIPEMRAWHGTANALGFGLAGLVAWTLAERSPAILDGDRRMTPTGTGPHDHPDG